MNNESDMKRGVSSVKRHYNPSILKETDPHEGMDEIALRELVTTLRTRIAEVEGDAAVMRQRVVGEIEYQSAVLKDISERCQDIMEDVDVIIPCDDQEDALLGIKSVAEAQVHRITTIKGGLISRLEILKEYLAQQKG